MMYSNVLNSREKPAVSPMSGSPTFDTGKKQKQGEFITPPRLTGRRSNKAVFAHVGFYLATEFWTASNELIFYAFACMIAYL